MIVGFGALNSKLFSCSFLGTRSLSPAPVGTYFVKMHGTLRDLIGNLVISNSGNLTNFKSVDFR